MKMASFTQAAQPVTTGPALTPAENPAAVLRGPAIWVVVAALVVAALVAAVQTGSVAMMPKDAKPVFIQLMTAPALEADRLSDRVAGTAGSTVLHLYHNHNSH